jgi:hypothetical protein
MNKPALYLRTVLFQPSQEFCRRLIRVLVDRMNFVAGLKVGYVIPKTLPYRDPLGPQIIKDIHLAAPVCSVSLALSVAVTVPDRKRDLS